MEDNVKKKRLGSLGEMAVATFLMRKGYSVFAELGDMSRKDLVVEVDNRLVSIQVKTTNKKRDRYFFWTKKSGPGNYKYTYSVEDVDVFALYCPEDDTILWMTSEEFLKNSAAWIFRTTATKNNQQDGINYIENFSNIERISCFSKQVLPEIGKTSSENQE